MRYPSMTAPDAGATLSAKRNGGQFDADGSFRLKGAGAELDQSFVEDLRSELTSLKARWPEGLRNDKERNEFEGSAARLVHRIVPSEPEILSDPEFWTWLSVICLPDFVEWRYGNKEGGTKPANYGIGSRTENLLYRLWLRAELVLDDQHQDRYHLVDAGQIDFYRSHLFRQGYANVRSFSRALLRFQYPQADTVPKLKILEIRELVKRLRRLRANLFLEILPEEECRAVIESEAAVILAA
jgi:hypothetical protein